MMVDKNRPGRGGNRDAGRGSVSPGSDDAPDKSTPQVAAQDLDAEIAATIALLVELFPNCFTADEARRRPVRVRINDDIRRAAGGVFTPRQLNRALRSYTRATAYLRRLRAGIERIDLAGSPAGLVSAKQEAHAAERLALLANSTEREPVPKATITQTPPVLARPAPPSSATVPKLHDLKTGRQTITTPSAPTAPAPKRLGLRDLKAAWQGRQRNRAAGNATDN
jgi:sRNA-binding protein